MQPGTTTIKNGSRNVPTLLGKFLRDTTLARAAAFGLGATISFAALHPAVAEDYPSRQVTLIVPFPAGGGVDIAGRLIAQKLTDALGQQVIVENRPGAGSQI